MKKINFVLPGGNKKPIGGYKVVYEYANRFSKDGYFVNIILPATILWKEKSIIEKMKGIIRFFYFKIKKQNYLPYSWFPLEKKISIYWVPTLEEKYIPDGDYIFATACQTAEYVGNYTDKKGEKIYLIQSYEKWAMEEERLIKTWKMKMKKIVISKYLYEKAIEMKEKSYYIENGLDFKEFFIMSEIVKEPKTIMMLYHKDENVKQSRKALGELLKLKDKNKDLKIILFGVEKKEKNIPNWVEYYHLPSKEKLRQLYNRSTIFVSPSKIEGWALPPAEAMQCKTCVCVTDIPGHEYITHLKTGYKVSDNLENLNTTLEHILKNNEIREKIELEGYNYIQRFTWDKSYSKLKNIINTAI